MNFWERGSYSQNNNGNNTDAGGSGNACGNNGQGRDGANVFGGNGTYSDGNFGNSRGGANAYRGNGTNPDSNRAQNRANDGGMGRNGSAGCSEQDVRDKFNEYSSKSEQQLMSELSALVNKMKSDGSFDPQAIENLYNTAAPFLNEMQRERMRAIIDMIRG